MEIFLSWSFWKLDKAAKLLNKVKVGNSVNRLSILAEMLVIFYVAARMLDFIVPNQGSFFTLITMPFIFTFNYLKQFI